MSRMIVAVGIVLCSVILQTCWATDEAANEMVESILREGNRYLKYEIDVDEVVNGYYRFPMVLNITVDKRRVVVPASEVTETKDPLLALITPTEGLLTAYLSAGEVVVYVDHMTIRTSLATFNCKGELVYDDEFVVETNVNKTADCNHCPAKLRGRDYKPQLRNFTCDWIMGKVFSLIVNAMEKATWLTRPKVFFSGTAFEEAVLTPFQEAARHNACKCSA